MALASAYRAGGDAEGATLELQAARSAFTRLGAVLDERRVMQLLGEGVDRPAEVAAGDGYFAGFRDSAGAIECAVQIQRTLAGHRREYGFAVPVRIGLHQAAATRVGLDYRGKGVHEAARIGAMAQGGEILASWHTAQPCKYATSDPRPVNLKGITEPVQVVSVSWR